MDFANVLVQMGIPALETADAGCHRRGRAMGRRRRTENPDLLCTCPNPTRHRSLIAQ
jgi:hypothetical protein